MNFDRYSWGNFKSAIKRGTYVFANSMLKRKFSGGINVMSEDWDNLILLDACRYDYFKKINYLEGDLQCVISQGSTSSEFMEGNFAGRTFHDTVYVSTNPHIERIGDDVFYTVRTTYQDENNLYPGWMPERVVNMARDAAEDFPDKRLIIHFMQPHSPYIGPVAIALRKRLVKETDVDFTNSSLMHEYSYGTIIDEISREDIVRVYIENLAVVLRHVEDLLEDLEGKTVISSDHGELLGDYSKFTIHAFKHPAESYLPKLRKIPWFEIPNDSRRDIKTEPGIGFERSDDDVLDNQLEALGYLT